MWMSVCLSRVHVACRASARIQWAASTVSVHRASDWTPSASTVTVLPWVSQLFVAILE